MTPTDQRSEALRLATMFHEAYERLAPKFGYETRLETRVFDPTSKNGQLMVAVCEEISAELRRLAEENERLKAQAVPEGWKLVPIEPTPEMSKAGFRVAKMDVTGAWVTDANEAYHAMLNAAPQPAAPTQVETQGWQPIETAPKDGTRILIYTPKATRQKVQEAYWVTPWEDAPEDECWWGTPHGPAGRGYTILTKSATHWMPLPAAPSTPPMEQDIPAIFKNQAS